MRRKVTKKLLNDQISMNIFVQCLLYTQHFDTFIEKYIAVIRIGD